jgi:hypothetical protein
MCGREKHVPRRRCGRSRLFLYWVLPTCNAGDDLGILFTEDVDSVGDEFVVGDGPSGDD